MKKNLFALILLLLGFALHAAAQGIVVHHNDGTKSVFRTTDIDSVTMVTEADSYVMGKWYLGFWKKGTSIIHFDGTEYMLFAGKYMEWGGKGGEPEKYTVSYYPKNKLFIAKDMTTGEMQRWTVHKQTDNLLVLRVGEVYRYFYTTQREADKAQFELDPPNHTETSDINTILRYAEGNTKSSLTPMGVHFENKHQTTDADREWLLNADNEPDKVAGLTQWKKKTVNLYPFGDPKPADVNQHSIGDCCCMAVFASLAYLCPDFIKSIVTDNGDDTYTVKMYDPKGQQIDVCVSSKILCNGNGDIGQCTGKNNAVTWATIMEKAMMKYVTLYKNTGVEGIATEVAAPMFTGDGVSYAFSPNSLYTSELKVAIEWSLAQGNITVGGFNVDDLPCGKLSTVTGHAFTFMLTDDEEKSPFVMRNPWGWYDVDGKLTIPYERTTVQTIDARIVMPGAAREYMRTSVSPYTPPKFQSLPTDLGVSERLLSRKYVPGGELW
ncbi:MAG: hypothetical protein J6129_01095 [Bacteroidaceae bacterium]|nr:hypothetical protein [Bacteroidaceae bacterium]